MSEKFIFGLTLGVALSPLWPRGQAGSALDAAHFMVSGCLDAPDEIPAGGWRSYEFGPTEDDHGIGPVTFPREPHHQDSPHD